MKWLVDKVDTSDMTVRFKSRRAVNDQEITYRITLSKNFRDYIKEEGYKGVRFGYDTVKGENVLALGLTTETQGANLIGIKGDIRNWFNITSYIEQYISEGVEVNFLKNYRVNVRKNGTATLELVES